MTLRNRRTARSQSAWFTLRQRLIRALTTLSGAALLGSVTVPLPACEHWNCSVDCDFSRHRCTFDFDATNCPTDRGCHREMACRGAVQGYGSASCVDFATEDVCVRNAACKWQQVCENDVIACEDIHDGDTCEHYAPDTVGLVERDATTCQLWWTFLGSASLGPTICLARD